MKILEIVTSSPPYILHPKCEKRGASGYDIITFEIAKRLSEIDTNMVDVLTLTQHHPEHFVGKLRFVCNSIYTIISHISVVYFFKYLIGLYPYASMKMTVIRDIIYTALISGYVNSLIKTGKYDVIHVHGCLLLLKFLDVIADKYKTKLVITLHGLNSFSNTTIMAPSIRLFEKHYIKHAYNNNQIVTFVSTGCIRTVQKYLGVTDTPNFHTTLNGTDFTNEETEYLDIRSRYHIPSDSKVLLYIGTISKRKNQIAVIKSFDSLNKSIRENTYFLFIGGIHDRYAPIWKAAIEHSMYKSHFIECGFVDKSILPNYYSQSNGVVLISFSEGFGLSIIEGMSFGKPSLVDKTMDVVDDILDEKSIIVVDNTNTQSIASGIVMLLTKQWDEDYIRKRSEAFTMDRMACRYNEILNKVFTSKEK